MREYRKDESTDSLRDESSTLMGTKSMVRNLVARARLRRLSSPPDLRDNVLLDIEVDGVRCTLTDAAQPDDTDTLSAREIEIARMVMQGHTNKIIGAALDISIWTVGAHLRRIFLKLGVRTRAAMVTAILREEERGSRSLVASTNCTNS